MSIELRFRELLNTQDNLDQVAEELLHMAANRKIKYQQIAKITNFLINAGLFQDAFRQYPRRFYEKSKITWPQFIEILYQTKTKVEEPILNAIIEGVQYKKKVSSLVTNSHWKYFSKEFSEDRKKLWKAKSNELTKKKESLKQKLQFLKENRMIEEEKRTFQKFLTIFPNDSEIAQEFEEFKERWAREVIAKKIESNKSEATYKVISVPKLTAEEKKLCEFLLADIKKRVSENIPSAYDFALFFYFLDYPKGGLEVLDLAPDEYRCHWLRGELLIENNQYLDLLSYIEKIQPQYTDDSEAQFACTYLRARALNKLGHHNRAIELLNSIVAIRPFYRSAQSLIAEWQKESL